VTDPPKLSHRFSDSVPVVAAGTVLWALGALVAALVTGFGEVFWTCVAGIGVGAFGASVFAWQRAAARRGSRSAQSGLDE
jgi:Protein of unknown function (DUF2530)